MDKRIILLLLILLCASIHAQEKNPTELAQPIVEEGKRLYRSEMASWFGTDVFLNEYDDHESIGGYFSYSEGDTSKCIFFSDSENPIVMGTIGFDSTYNIESATIDLSERAYTDNEKQLFLIRRATLSAIQEDTLFKLYKNTNLNLIPIIHGGEKKVYILTGPQKSGVVIFGNDYLIRFNKRNRIIEKKRLHQNIIPVEYGQTSQEEKGEQAGTVHSHRPETGDFITATDICTLMLYAKYADWKEHQVISKKYLNIWNCETNNLIVVPVDGFRKGK